MMKTLNNSLRLLEEVSARGSQPAVVEEVKEQSSELERG